MRRRHLLGFLAAVPPPARAVTGGVDSPAWRPSRSIRLVVPVSAGGSQDAVARILARPMSEELAACRSYRTDLAWLESAGA